VSGRPVAHHRDGAPITGCPAHKDRIAPHVQRSQKIREDQGRSGKIREALEQYWQEQARLVGLLRQHGALRADRTDDEATDELRAVSS